MIIRKFFALALAVAGLLAASAAGAAPIGFGNDIESGLNIRFLEDDGFGYLGPSGGGTVGGSGSYDTGLQSPTVYTPTAIQLAPTVDVPEPGTLSLLGLGLMGLGVAGRRRKRA